MAELVATTSATSAWMEVLTSSHTGFLAPAQSPATCLTLPGHSLDSLPGAAPLRVALRHLLAEGLAAEQVPGSAV